jgi:DNA-binding transcriptional ArsR family regulator
MKYARVNQASIDHTFLALSDPTRRGAIKLLRKGPLRAGELASALDMNRPAMTRHLRVLRESGLVHEEGLEEDARVRVYRLRRAPFDDLRTWLEEIEQHWGLQLESFKRHAERTRGRKAKAARGRAS